ncbi:MAG: hypothetical protein ACK4MV_16310 [Beijerinckiaceae bacterium]
MTGDIIAQHWTPKGVLRLKFCFVGGSHNVMIWLDDREIEMHTDAAQAAQAIHSGKVDGKLGFSAAGYGVPAEFWKWTMGQWPVVE